MTTLFPIGVQKQATLSDDGLYRYRLTRTWDESRGRVNFLMLNPSVADADIDDPTIRKCVGFAKSWGFGELVVTNLFAWRSTDPKALKWVVDPVGPFNDWYLVDTARRSERVVCGWGTHGPLFGRDRAVRSLLRAASIPTYHLGLTRGGQPGHPLFLPYTANLIPWEDP